MKKTLWTIFLILIIGAVVFCFIRYNYVFASGTKAGLLNTFQKKGYVFKTWEGKLIQSGFKANVQSNEFEFSVVNDKIAAVLEQNSGREVNVHYISYFGTLPWRGMSEFIVDSIYEIRESGGEPILKPK